nr:unnamed protein product [Callosobruchus analis]
MNNQFQASKKCIQIAEVSTTSHANEEYLNNKESLHPNNISEGVHVLVKLSGGKNRYYTYLGKALSSVEEDGDVKIMFFKSVDDSGKLFKLVSGDISYEPYEIIVKIAIEPTKKKEVLNGVFYRYLPKTLPQFPQCGHTGKPYQPFQCSSLLTMRDIKYFYDAFYKTSSKVAQDHFILKHCSASNLKRSRKRKEEIDKVVYTVRRRDGLLVKVCRQSFMDILGVKKDRILNILKRYKDNNEMPLERRGGDRFTHIEEVQIIFPVVGHSYIPPDRLFGQIEKVTMKKSEITSPEQYIEIIQKWGKVYKLGDDIPVFDWKSNVHVLVKPPSQWHFKLQLSKRIIISRRNGSIAVRGESFYRNNLER